MKKILGLILVGVLLLAEGSARATPAFQKYAGNDWLGTTSGTTPADTASVAVQPGLYSVWDDGIVEVNVVARAWLSTTNQRIFSRKFLISVVNGSMSLAGSQTLFADVSQGIGLLLANVDVTIDNTNHVVYAKVTGVSGSTVSWLVTANGSAFSAN